MTNRIASAEGSEERRQFVLYLGGKGCQFRSIGKFQFLMVSEVEFEFDEGSEMQQALPQRGKFVEDGAS